MEIRDGIRILDGYVILMFMNGVFCCNRIGVGDKGFDCGMVIFVFVWFWGGFRCFNGCLYFLFCVDLFKSVENLIFFSF